MPYRKNVLCAYCGKPIPIRFGVSIGKYCSAACIRDAGLWLDRGSGMPSGFVHGRHHGGGPEPLEPLPEPVPPAWYTPPGAEYVEPTPSPEYFPDPASDPTIAIWEYRIPFTPTLTFDCSRFTFWLKRVGTPTTEPTCQVWKGAVWGSATFVGHAHTPAFPMEILSTDDFHMITPYTQPLLFKIGVVHWLLFNIVGTETDIIKLKMTPDVASEVMERHMFGTGTWSDWASYLYQIHFRIEYYI